MAKCTCGSNLTFRRTIWLHLEVDSEDNPLSVNTLNMLIATSIQEGNYNVTNCIKKEIFCDDCGYRTYSAES